MTGIEQDLLAIEKKFWTGDEAYYRQHVDGSCLVAFKEMSGLMSNGELAATVRDGQRWKKLEIEGRGLVRPTDDIAILTYEAKAERATGAPHHAIVSTGYVKRDDGWKMMFHAQTPLDGEKTNTQTA